MEQNFLASDINLSRAFLDLPRMTMSSAKKIAEMLVSSRSNPSPEEFNRVPRSFMNREKRSGDKLQPVMDFALNQMIVFPDIIPCFTPRVSHNSSEYLPLMRNRRESFLYIDWIKDKVFPPKPRCFSFENSAGLQTESYAWFFLR